MLSTFTVSNTDDHGPGSLRQAITSANGQANGGSPDEIHFAISGSGVHTISPTSALPTIDESVLLLGTTQTGYAGTPLIELVGTAAGTGVNGLTINAGGTTVSGLVINRFTGDGIVLATKGGDTITACWIGTDSSGKLDKGNTGVGLRISGASSNMIGGHNDPNASLIGAGNVISGNDSGGIVIARGPKFPEGEAATSNVLLGNFVGTDATGTARIGNFGNGVVISTGSNQIGDDSPAGDNVISGNVFDGLVLQGAFATGNSVLGNRIGSYWLNFGPLGNGGDGVSLSSGASNTTLESAFIEANGGNGVVISGTGTRTNIVQLNLISGDALDGVKITDAPGNTIGGTARAAGYYFSNEIWGNAGNGVEITGASATSNLVLGNASYSNLDGVRIEAAPGNTIGGAAAQEGNEISGNSVNGVEIIGTSAAGNLVVGNIIGLDSIGPFTFANGGSGIVLDGAPGNIIGGAGAGAGNAISGNTENGVQITGASATGNLVLGNMIGLDPGGTIALGNGGSGVVLTHAHGTTIGGTAAGAGNVISSNAHDGILIQNIDSTGNLIQGNRIGTNAAGTAALGNGLGVDIYVSPGNTIGGTAAGDGNVISGNTGNGIVMQGFAASENLVQGNLIGTDATGTARLGNTTHGIEVRTGSNNTIGGTVAGAANTIAFSSGAGVDVTDGLGNLISANSIRDNGGLGIDLGDDVVTPNDPGDGDAGPNLLQNFPSIVSAVSVNGATIIRGTLDSVPSRSFTLEWFASAIADRTGFGQGASFLGTTTVVTDASGRASVLNALPFAVPLGHVLSATAIDQDGNTSGFSLAATVKGPALVQWSVSGLAVDENAGTATLLITRTGNPDVPVTVHVATGGGDALAGINYTPIDTVLTFQPGVLTQTLTITVRDDGMVTPDRQVVVTLDKPSQGSILGTPASTTLVIRNTDMPPLVRMVGLRLVTDRKKNITQVIVSLSGGVNPDQANQLAIFRLATAGKRGSFDAKNAQILKLRSIRYDAATATITLTLLRSFRLAKTVQFRINGSAPAGLIDASGRLIDGDHDGRPGGNAIALLRKRGVTIA